MTVCIDAGNSSLKLASVSDGRVGPIVRLPARPVPEAMLVAEHIAELAFSGPPGGGVGLVSVVPALEAVVREAADVVGAALLVADAARIPMAVRLEHPARVGADRLLAAWGAQAGHGTPLVVVDLGTATTVDAVAADGAFLGGAILPGLELGRAALAGGTAQLPDIPLTAPTGAIGRDTVAAMRSGVVLGHLGAIRELVTRIAAELTSGGARPTVVATGGVTAAPWAREALLRPAGPTLPAIADVVDPELLLRSLGLLAARHLAVAP